MWSLWIRGVIMWWFVNSTRKRKRKRELQKENKLISHRQINIVFIFLRENGTSTKSKFYPKNSKKYICALRMARPFDLRLDCCCSMYYQCKWGQWTKSSESALFQRTKLPEWSRQIASKDAMSYLYLQSMSASKWPNSLIKCNYKIFPRYSKGNLKIVGSVTKILSIVDGDAVGGKDR